MVVFEWTASPLPNRISCTWRACQAQVDAALAAHQAQLQQRKLRRSISPHPPYNVEEINV